MRAVIRTLLLRFILSTVCVVAVASAVATPVVGGRSSRVGPRHRSFATERRISRTHAAIVQGTYVKTRAYPYQVYLRVFLSNGTVDFCGGAIVSHRHVLTAAHCVKKPNLQKVLAVIGNPNRFSKKALTFPVIREKFYNTSAGERVEADIVILTVDRDIPVGSSNIKTLKIQGNRKFNRKVVCTVAGWGESRDSSDPDILKAIQVPLVNQKRCRKSYPKDPPDDLLCAGYYYKGGMDTCQGDSGSPLVCEGKLTGIVKGGIGCGLPFYPGTYTDVTYYRAWIKKAMVADLRSEYQESLDKSFYIFGRRRRSFRYSRGASHL